MQMARYTINSLPSLTLPFSPHPLLPKRPQNGIIQLCRAAEQPERDGNEDPYWVREEQRWVREEQRWVREEQRWVREEARWNAERDSLLNQISELRLQIQHLESELENRRVSTGSGTAVSPSPSPSPSPSLISVSDMLAKITSLLQALNSNNNNSGSSNKQIAESGESMRPLVLETKSENLESKKLDMDRKPPEKKTRLSLRMGSEGEEVRALQEALLSLGFYSGEEDMEYSSFSEGTQRAVKTWQASTGRPEDGIMTAELLERLYTAQRIQNFGSSFNAHQDKANGAATASVTEVREVQQTVVNKGPTNVEVSQHRVFLLGENRWEEPSRVKKGNDKPTNGAKIQVSATECRACRGDGRLICMECDGTGEPNVEPQFLEWVEEGAHCPYCDGLGYTVCDVCEGKAIA